MVSFQTRHLLPPQQQLYQQSQKGNVRLTKSVKGKGKAYTLTVDQVDASGEVVTSIILMHSTLAYVLVESGATHCFISSHSLVSIIYPVTQYIRVGQLALGMGKYRVIRCVRDVP